MGSAPLYRRLALIGIGLIGSSIARFARTHGLVESIVCADRIGASRSRAKALGLVEEAFTDPAAAVADADLVIVCTPLSSYETVARAIAPALAPKTVVSDVGSVKQAAIALMAPHLPGHVHFIPGHPVAGTEKSGPDAGFETLFKGRWAVLTPLPDTDAAEVDRLAAFWRGAGASIEIMEPQHHDRIMALTSHLPHLIAYNIVGTVADLEGATKSEVIKFAASGFRDFTRIAGSDPVMWRDVFMNNRDAVLEMLGRFTEDLTALQRAIRWGEADKLEALFTRTRAIRRSVIDAGQA